MKKTLWRSIAFGAVVSASAYLLAFDMYSWRFWVFLAIVLIADKLMLDRYEGLSDDQIRECFEDWERERAEAQKA